jgi:hypothetical protein
MRISPSISPAPPDDQDVYLVLDDFGGRFGRASGADRGDIVRQIIAIVSEEARGLGDNALDEGMPGG